MTNIKKEESPQQITLSPLIRNTVIIGWVLFKITLVAVMTNEAPGDFIYSSF